MAGRDATIPLGNDEAMGENMTEKDQAALQFIKVYTDEKGYAPNFTEIMEAVGERSKAGITRSLKRLTEQGLITRSPGVARSIRVVDFSH